MGRLVDLDGRAVDRNPGENAATAGIREDFGAQLRIRGGFGTAPDRAGRDRRAGAQRELAAEQPFHAFPGPKDEHNIGRLHAGLPAYAAAREDYKLRDSPSAVTVANQHDPAPSANAAYEADLYDAGDDHETL